MKARRGFASMDPDKQREIASKGGKIAHLKGVGHQWNSEEARAAGKKGGAATRGILKPRKASVGVQEPTINDPRAGARPALP